MSYTPDMDINAEVTTEETRYEFLVTTDSSLTTKCDKSVRLQMEHLNGQDIEGNRTGAGNKGLLWRILDGMSWRSEAAD